MSLISRINDLSIAIRDKFNSTTPRLVPTGGISGQVLTKTGTGGTDFSWQTSGSSSVNEEELKSFAVAMSIALGG